MPLRFTLVSSLLLAVAAPIAIFSQAPGAPAPQPTHSCAVDRTQPNAGDLALARKDYDAALTFYRAALEKDPTSPEAHLGLVRSLIGKDQTHDAIDAAQAELTNAPKNAIAEIAADEAAYRNADFESTLQHARTAAQDDPCEGRAIALVAEIDSINALFATENRLLSLARRLRPNDELIRRDWINSLPRAERKIELGNYLNGHPSLSAKDLNNYTNEELYLNAHQPGECHITTKAQTTRIPFVPVSDEFLNPQAYGLDVLLNGKRRRMQIDTGASGIILTPGAAKRLGLTPEYQFQISGVGDEGDVKSYLTHVAGIRIGDVEISHCLVEVLRKPPSHMDADGLIGVDIFNQFLVTLDYQKTELRLNPLPPRIAVQNAPGLKDTAGTAQQDEDEDDVPHDAIVPPQMRDPTQDWLHVVRIGHELLLPSRVNGGPLHYLIADTGAAKTIFSLPLAREAGKPSTEPEVHFGGISGTVKLAYSLDNAVLQFGHLLLPRATYPAFDITNISHDSGVEISGFVGLPTLSRLTITIDYRDNLMQLKYDPRHDDQRFF